MYVDPSGCFPVLAFILGLTALFGMGLTIGGVASDNNIMTAIGLTMVAIPALISGGLAAFATTGTLAKLIGAGTMLAGVGTGLFASAEYQESFTGNNWMSSRLGEGWYNGLMIATAAIATAGTIALSVLTSIGNMAKPDQMINSISKNPNRWKQVKEVKEAATGRKYRGGTSYYRNYINKWTGAKAGSHIIIRNGEILHKLHYHLWIS